MYLCVEMTQLCFRLEIQDPRLLQYGKLGITYSSAFVVFFSLQGPVLSINSYLKLTVYYIGHVISIGPQSILLLNVEHQRIDCYSEESLYLRRSLQSFPNQLKHVKAAPRKSEKSRKKLQNSLCTKKFSAISEPLLHVR